MKITNKQCKLTEFRDVPTGYVFRYSNAVYMKTEGFSGYDDNDCSVDFDAVDLETGELIPVNAFEEVEILDEAEVILR